MRDTIKDRRDLRLAVLIDADNIPYGYVKAMLGEVAKIGVPTVKRIYADWSKPSVSGWRPVLLEHAIIPMQQYSYTVGKNATDSAMIIDAMDILYKQNVDGFCLISSDSDFTRLATRLRESGMIVIGIGEKKTPVPFIVACDKFIYLEIIANPELPVHVNEIVEKIYLENTTTIQFDAVDSETIELLKRTVEDLADDTGWAFLGDVGNLILKKKSDFDPRNFGYPKLTPLLKSLHVVFDIDQRVVDNNTYIKHIYVRIRE
ncbi:MAG: hypothetical protein RL662_617 [Bacteroidota bacterium]|jgi:hypothetical protein